MKYRLSRKTEPRGEKVFRRMINGSDARLFRKREIRGESGMVTAELALGAVIVGGFAIFIAWTISVLYQYALVQNTAGEVARQEARGDVAAVAAVIADAPKGSKVDISRKGDQVVVAVELTARPWGELFPALKLQSQAQVTAEG